MSTKRWLRRDTEVAFDPGKLEAAKRKPSGFDSKKLEAVKASDPGLISRAIEFGKENVGPIIGGTAGMALAGPPGAALGGAAGRAYQDIATRYISPEQAPQTAGEAAKRIGLEAGAQYLGAKYLPPVAGAIGEQAAKIGAGAYKYVAKNITGLSDDAMKALYDNPSSVMKYARMGAEKAAEISSDAAKQFKSLIDANIEAASDTYGKLIGIVRSNEKYGPGFKLNLQEGIGQKVADIQVEFGYNIPGRVAEEAEANTFQKFMLRANELKSATPEEVYFFQKDLNAAIRNNRGKTISSALAKVKGEVMDYIEQSIPEIAPANKIYRKAMELSEDLSRVVNADDAAAVIKRALRSNSETKDAILKASDEIAWARQSLEQMVEASAGKEAAPWLRSMPQTGFTPGVYGGIGFAIAKGGMAAKAGGLASLPFLSPRIVGMGAQAGIAASGLAQRYGQQAVRGTAPVAAAGLSQYYSGVPGIEHFYRLYK